MRAAQTSTVDKHVTLFEHCDVFIDTDKAGWSLIVANPKGRAAIDAMIDRPIHWDHDFGTPVQSLWASAPPDWRAVDINLAKYEADGYAKRVPQMSNAHPTVHLNTLRLGCGAIGNTPGLRVIFHDDRHGWARLELENDKATTNVVDFATGNFQHGSQAIKHHRLSFDSYPLPNGKRSKADYGKSRKRDAEGAIEDIIAAQRSTIRVYPACPVARRLCSTINETLCKTHPWSRSRMVV